MTVRVGINGFGRMGRLGLRAGWDNGAYEITHVNEIAGDAACMAHLLEFDSVHGRRDRTLTGDGSALHVDGKPVGYSMQDSPDAVDWAGMGIDLVIGDESEFDFVWITRFPLLEYDDTGKRLQALHHPFTSPLEEDYERLKTDPLSVLSRAYDLVLNGSEIGGGSIRIHQREIQEAVLEALGLERIPSNSS